MNSKSTMTEERKRKILGITTHNMEALWDILTILIWLSRLFQKLSLIIKVTTTHLKVLPLYFQVVKQTKQFKGTTKQSRHLTSTKEPKLKMEL